MSRGLVQQQPAAGAWITPAVATQNFSVDVDRNLRKTATSPCAQVRAGFQKERTYYTRSVAGSTVQETQSDMWTDSHVFLACKIASHRSAHTMACHCCTIGLSLRQTNKKPATCKLAATYREYDTFCVWLRPEWQLIQRAVNARPRRGGGGRIMYHPDRNKTFALVSSNDLFKKMRTEKILGEYV